MCWSWTARALFAVGSVWERVWPAHGRRPRVVNRAFLPAAGGGRIVYLAPPPGAGEQADAARAGLENLARTLSVEWARHAITAVTIALGDTTAPGEAAALTAYLASPAGRTSRAACWTCAGSEASFGG